MSWHCPHCIGWTLAQSMHANAVTQGRLGPTLYIGPLSRTASACAEDPKEDHSGQRVKFCVGSDFE